MNFTKMQGIGNDYVYINGFEDRVENPGELAPSQTISFGGFPQPHARCAP